MLWLNQISVMTLDLSVNKNVDSNFIFILIHLAFYGFLSRKLYNYS